MSGTDYNFRRIEHKWQTEWREKGDFRAPRYPDNDSYFVLVYPPYPNGKIHMGHVRNYTIGDVVARYKRLCGLSVLHPIGFDAFGLPNEIEAARQQVGPASITSRNIEIMREQLQGLGYSYDWSSAIVTTDPEYYRWNQWLFLNLYHRGLAYRKAASVQWCVSCRTSLANQQVYDGRCWRCDEPVETRHQRQWFFRLRSYAEELWRDAEAGAFPDNIATMLKQWLKRSDGAELRFQISQTEHVIPVFTTRPELSYGATFLALSPDHPLAEELTSGAGLEAELERLREQVRTCENLSTLREGIDTGRRAIHPLTGEAIPIWLAAYVDSDFGTGAVMGNPCHDENDHSFGIRHGLPGKMVVLPEGSSWSYRTQGPYLGTGRLIDSGLWSGRAEREVREDLLRDWEAKGFGEHSIVFGIRDWLVSRQRGWGTPIPIVHCSDCGEVGMNVDDLPVRLPDDLRDTGSGNPLAERPDFVSCTCPRCGRPAQRETDTMDTFIDTAWYYLRCSSPEYRESIVDPAAVRSWGQADLYVGGLEISVPIMLYGGFVTKALRDDGSVNFGLPCGKLLAHEMVLMNGRKMSKSLGNTVDPTELVNRVGADSVRLLTLSLAPPLKALEWSETRLQGCHRFLRRVWNLGGRIGQTELRPCQASHDDPFAWSKRLTLSTHRVIHSVTRDLERLQFNTCVTELIKFVYSLEELEPEICICGSAVVEHEAMRRAFETLIVLLSPFSPHVCAELWSNLELPIPLCQANWPQYDPALLAETTKPIMVKVNAKTVARVEIPADANQADALAIARSDESVRSCIGGAEISREIYVPGQVINFVTASDSAVSEKR